jgi:hypothetical protein
MYLGFGDAEDTTIALSWRVEKSSSWIKYSPLVMLGGQGSTAGANGNVHTMSETTPCPKVDPWTAHTT